MKYNKTKYPNIYTYETKKGKRYYVRRNFKLNGKKKEITKSNLKTLAEARLALADIETKIDSNDYDPRLNMTVNEYWEMYSNNRIKTGRWAPDTIVNKQSIFKNHFAKRYGKMKLKDIDRVGYESFLIELLKKCTRTTVQQTSAVFEAMLSDAVVNGYLDKNPILKIYVGESAKTPQNKRVSLGEFKAWDDTARKVLDKYNYVMVRLTYFGLRKSEVLGIKFNSLKLINGRFRIKLDESRTPERPEGGAMKTDGSERYAVVDEETTALLKYAIKESKEIAKSVGRILGKDDFLFLGDYRGRKKLLGKPISCYRIRRNFERISEISGVHATPHMMRHFFATQSIIAGASIEHLAITLGHSTSYMTQKYTHIQDEVANEVTNLFLEAIE